MTIAALYPNTRPTLNLDFANSQTVDPRITFTRTGTAAYYDGKTTVKAEENLLRYSQEFDNGNWFKAGNTVTANSTTAPDGTSTAETSTASAITGLVEISAIVTAGVIPSSSAATFSAYFKAGTKSAVTLSYSSGSADWVAAVYDLAGGTVSQTAASGAGTITGTSIVSVGSGWYRCVISFTLSNSSSAVNVAFTGMAPATTGNTFVNNGRISGTYVGTETIYIWGAQLEQRSTVTDYTPTTTQAITNYIPAIQYAPANTPRIDFDPITGECKGLLIEEQRTNLLTYSEQFDNAAWLKNNCTISTNVIITPDGTLTGDAWQRSSTAASFVQQTVIKSGSSTPYSGSFMVKIGSVGRYFAIRLQGTYPNRADCVFDLQTGTAASPQNYGSGFSGVSSIYNHGNGWYRCVVSTPTTDVAAGLYLIGSFNANGSNQVDITDSASNTNGYIWGAQLEAGAFPTSYIPTVASQVTRAADSASMTGTNFSSWYRADEGSFYAEYATLALTTSACVISQNVSNREFLFGGSGGVNSAARTIDNTNGVLVSTNAFIGAGNPVKGAMLYGSSSRSIVAMGNTPTTGAYDGVYMSATILYIGKASSATNTLNGHIKKLSYYPKRLTNTELQALTA